MSKMHSVLGALVVAVLGAYLLFAQHTLSFFITSKGPGNRANLGGLAGADKHCQNLAAAVGAGSRTWHAYLSVTGFRWSGGRQCARPDWQGPLVQRQRRARGGKRGRSAQRQEQPGQTEFAYRKGRSGQRPGRQSQPPRYADRLTDGRQSIRGCSDESDLRKLDQPQRGWQCRARPS